MGNSIAAYKGRKIDLNKPVEVYKNLHIDQWSIRQDGLVVGHARALALTDCTFHVSQVGRKRVLGSGRKNVHAFVRGYWVSHLATSRLGIDYTWDVVMYNPHKFPTFVCDTVLGFEELDSADIAYFPIGGRPTCHNPNNVFNRKLTSPPLAQ